MGGIVYLLLHLLHQWSYREVVASVSMVGVAIWTCSTIDRTVCISI